MGESTLAVGDVLPVEIAGVEVGGAVIEEITDDYVEVIIKGNALQLPPDVLDYFELFRSMEEA